MKRIYIAGKYVPKDCTIHDASRLAQQNVDKAIKAFHQLKAQGYEPFVPHLSHYLHIQGDSDYGDWWYSYDRTFLDHWAEAIYMLDGWEESKGSVMELERAKELGLTIVYQIKENDK
jgi:hypothetical protein